MMYTDLFSSMDGARSTFFWIMPMLSVSVVFMSCLWGATSSSATWNKISKLWGSKSIMRYNSTYIMISSIFFFLLINNMLGLSPMSYTFTSNLFMVSAMAVVMWMTMLLSGYSYAPMKSLAHLAPSGAPMPLLPFLVLIETVSIMIRPLTLTVRMVANISAGHIVLSLLANATTSFLHTMMFPAMVMLGVAYTLFEFFVSVIQAYIFSLLLTLYMEEHP
uniref:ATP synthase subunit a n=1 Tax=Dolicheulota formosensis TaxID=1632114 RepID=A0A0H3W557_DOLFO|nr:ATP synthase F0 subunit 6 [Dolicheulota formosensis]AKJ85730.1 ATP synthase F0 subunit 6 [Dolicheulota formosensis]